MSSFERKNFNTGFFWDTIKAKSFKLWLIVTLLEVYIVIITFLQFSTAIVEMVALMHFQLREGM